MQNCCRGTVLAFDVSPKRRLQADPGLDMAPSGGQLLWSRLSAFRKRPDVPTLAQVLMHILHCSGRMESERSRDLADLVITPPVVEIGLMDFERIDSMIDVAYQSCLEMAPRLAGLLGQDEGKSES